MPENLITMEVVDDPAVMARNRAKHERYEQNHAWLQSHWAELLSQASGKYVVVAAREAFLADTSAEARAMAMAAHPDEDGALCRFVITERVDESPITMELVDDPAIVARSHAVHDRAKRNSDWLESH